MFSYLSFNIIYLIISSLLIIPHSYSRIKSFNISSTDLSLYEVANNRLLLENNFTSKPALFKSYGPLFTDMNNIKYKNGIFFIPTLNDKSKPLFLAIYCTESLINVRGSNGWKGWKETFYTFENNIVNKLCTFDRKY